MPHIHEIYSQDTHIMNPHIHSLCTQHNPIIHNIPSQYATNIFKCTFNTHSTYIQYAHNIKRTYNTYIPKLFPLYKHNTINIQLHTHTIRSTYIHNIHNIQTLETQYATNIVDTLNVHCVHIGCIWVVYWLYIEYMYIYIYICIYICVVYIGSACVVYVFYMGCML